MKCATTICNAPPAVTVVWLGKPWAMCAACAERATIIGKALGMSVPVSSLHVAAEPMARAVEVALGGGDHWMLRAEGIPLCGAVPVGRHPHIFSDKIVEVTCEECLRMLPDYLAPAAGVRKT